jgi:hypothetical protein
MKIIRKMSRSKVTILRNQLVQTDRTNPNDKPDITIRDNENGTCMPIDVASAGDRNVIRKEHEKILKCNRNTSHIECKDKSDISNTGANENTSKPLENFVYLYVLRITTKCLWKSDRSFQLLLTQLRHSEKLPVA